MSYLDPQSWTDVDGGGNPLDWTTRQDKLLYPGYEMLRKALVERGGGGGLEPRAPGKIYPDSWFIDFHNSMTSLIPQYVNHADNGGNWDGVVPDDAAPLWTEATLLAYIGDAVRVPILHVPKAAWSLQQYKMLNALIWTKKQATMINRSTGLRQSPVGMFLSDDAFSVTWDEMWDLILAEFPQSWTYGVGVGDSRSSGASSTFWQITSNFYLAGMTRRTGLLRATVETGGFKVVVDWYGKAMQEPPHYQSEPTVWLPELALTEDRTAYCSSNSTPAEDIGGVIESDEYVPNINEPPGIPTPWRPEYEPVAGVDFDPYTQGWQINFSTPTPPDQTGIAVIKWNVTDGFKFV